MAGYAVGMLFDVEMGPGIRGYLEGIDATLAPYAGRFVVHGGAAEVREGEWDGGLVVIEFPAIEKARAWYDSPAYQAILALRADNSRGVILLVDGVDADHRATDVLPPELRQQAV